jgi:hypothetical protein
VTIFDYLKDITVTKRGDLPMDQYVPFLVNRWLSFINPAVCELVSLLNSQVFLEDKEMHYKMAIACFPKQKYTPRIKYIKKVKEQAEEEDQRVKILAQNFEISEREACLLLSGAL